MVFSFPILWKKINFSVILDGLARFVEIAIRSLATHKNVKVVEANWK